MLDELGEGLPLSDGLGEADELADRSSAEELASADAGSWLVALFVADDSTVFFGISRHSADLVLDRLLASAVCNSANVL